MHYPNFLSFSLDLMQPCYQDFSLTLMSKSKNTLKTSLDLTALFIASIYARTEGLVSNVDYLENQRPNFIQNEYDIKRRQSLTHPSFSGLKFFF